MSDLVRIIIGSDICPTPSDVEFFKTGKVDALLPKEFLALFDDSDFSIVNAECPLTEADSPISKMGPTIKAPLSCVNFYRNLGVSAACLANNHILDYGDQGVRDTLSAFERANIPTVGAGLNLESARRPLIHCFADGRTLALVAMAESEFCIAGTGSAGANPIDYPNFSMIRDLKGHHDKVIVLLHAGTELRIIPRPGLIDLCHFLVDQGADAVIVQHTHCVGGVERYRSGIIVYGQGNFLFGNLNPCETLPQQWWEGILLEILWRNVHDDFEIKLHPFMQKREGVGLRTLTVSEAQTFDSRQRDFATTIRDRAAVERMWQDFCASSRERVLLNLMGAKKILRILGFRGLPLARAWSMIADLRRIQNLISCESHRELVLDILRSSTKN